MKDNSRHTRNQGVALVAVLWIVIALMAVIIVHGRAMGVEAMAAKQHVSIAQCTTAEMGVEQYCLSAFDAELAAPGYLDQLNMEAREIGDCYFWIMTANPADESTPEFAMTSEASKLDLNTATYDQLMLLPGMTDEFAAAIIDWRQPDDGVQGVTAAEAAGAPSGTEGAEDQYYMMLPVPYHCKNAPFESVDELKLIKGATPDILFGADANHNNTIEPEELAAANQGTAFDISARGILSYVTVYGVTATTTNPAATQNANSVVTSQPAPLVDVNPPAAAAGAAAAGGGRARGGAAGATTTNTALQTLLQQYLPSQAQTIMQATTAAAASGRFTSVFNWAVRAQVTSDELSQIFTLITCAPPAPPTAAQVAAAAAAGTTTAPATQPAKIDANNATKVVLMSIRIQETEADEIIAQRANLVPDPTQKADIAWILDLIDPSEFATTTVNGITVPDVGEFLTGTSSVYSADIVTITKDGRAFKRTHIVIDGSLGNSQIVYRRDMTGAGWPLDPQLRESLRTGQGLIDTGGSNGTASKNNGLSLGLH